MYSVPYLRELGTALMEVERTYCSASKLYNFRSIHILVFFDGIEVLDPALGAVVALSGHSVAAS